MSGKYNVNRSDLPAFQLLADIAPSGPGTLSRIEAIIRSFRPSVYAPDNNFRPFDRAAPPRDFDSGNMDQFNDVVESCGKSVGRIEVLRDGQWHLAATCFRIGPPASRLIATAGHAMTALLTPGASVSHSLPIFISPLNAPLREARVNFNTQRFADQATQDHHDDPALIYPLGALRACHSRWDLLVAEIGAGAQPLPDPLPLEVDPEWGDPLGNPVLLLGHPDLSAATSHSAFSTVFGTPDGQFGLQASVGRLGKLAMPLPLAPDFNAMGICGKHDATTLPGSSGSPVISAATGRVVGIHFDGGEFEPDIARDINKHNRCIDLPVALIEQRLGGLMIDGMDNRELMRVPATHWSPQVPSWRSDMPLDDHETVWNLYARTRRAGGATSLQSGVVPDRPDFRDYLYSAGLTAVPTSHPAPAVPAARIRDQRASPACTGFALAALIDHQIEQLGRTDASGAPYPPVSERMLYESARLCDEWVDDAVGGSSLRGVIKGFFQNGVCTQAKAPWRSRDRWMLTRDISKEARNVTLGGYFRLPPDLLAFQAALVETRAILVSAHLHEGWRKPTGGTIRIRKERIGAHAFVVLGYDDKGFIIQNSWGAGWGRNGLARWSYEDWAENLIDAWVLRLAPGQPGTFDLRPRIAARAVVPPDRQRGPTPADTAALPLPVPRRHSLIGHVLNPDAGGFADSGALGGGIETLAETARFLATAEARSRYKRIAFFLHDPFLGPEPLSRIAGAMVEPLKQRDIYPVHIVYGLSEIETIRLRLLSEADQAAGRFVADPAALSDFVARRAGQVARPLWQHYLDGAARAAMRGGTLWTCLAGLMLYGKSRYEISLCAIGSGSVLAQALHSAGAPDHLGRGFDRNVLIAPILDEDERSALWRKQVRLWRLPPARPQPTEIAGYRGDWPDLIAAAFRPGPRLVRRPATGDDLTSVGTDLPATTVFGAFTEDSFRDDLAQRM